jgi:hypothetical protein
MRSYAALLAVALASPAGAQSPAEPSAPSGRTAPAASTAPSRPPVAAAPVPSAPSDPPDPPVASASPADLSRIKRRLGAGTPILDAVSTAAPVPTFRVSVTERIDIWKFWGDPEDVAALVRPRGGTWHDEFQAMVTPSVLKNGGAGLGNGERLQLAATGLAFAGAMKLLGIGVRQAKDARHNRTVHKAKEEVQRELEAFYLLHPEARPAASPTPP